MHDDPLIVGFGVQTLTANWRWLLFRGALAICVGIIALLFPLGALFAFTLVFAAWSGADGILSLIAGIRGAVHATTRWWALVLRGIVGILVAVIVALVPDFATLGYAIVTLAIIAMWALVTGVLEIAAAIRLRKAIRGEWLLALSGFLSITLGLAISWLAMTDPRASIISVAWVIGVYALLAGLLMVVFALRLRRFSIVASQNF